MAGVFQCDQDSFAFYEEGTESGSTIIGVKNAEQSLDVDTNYQCRLLIQEVGGKFGKDVDFEFQYNLNSGGWNNITTTSSVVKAVDSADLTEGEDCTQRIGSGSFETPNAGVTEDGICGGSSLDLDAGYEVEILLSFQIVSADVSDGDEILIRVTRDGGIELFSYTRNADIDVVKEGVVHEGAGQSDGTSTAAAAGNVEHTGAGQSDGVSTSSADGEVVHTGAGQADGTSTAAGSAEVLHTGSGQSDGIGAATGSGICIFAGAGQSDGTSTATGTGTTGTIHEGAGQSDGLSTASGSGNVEHTGSGQSDGVSTATADGEVIHTGVGQANGTSTAGGAGVCIRVGAAQSDGTSTATGTGEISGTVEGAAQSDGMSTASGSAVADFAGAGLSQGTSTATGTGVVGAVHEGAGQADGTSMVFGEGVINDMCTVTCTQDSEEVHKFEYLTADNATGLVEKIIDFSSPTVDWTYMGGYVWEGTGNRVLEIMGMP